MRHCVTRHRHSRNSKCSLCSMHFSLIVWKSFSPLTSNWNENAKRFKLNDFQMFSHSLSHFTFRIIHLFEFHLELHAMRKYAKCFTDALLQGYKISSPFGNSLMNWNWILRWQLDEKSIFQLVCVSMIMICVCVCFGKWDEIHSTQTYQVEQTHNVHVYLNFACKTLSSMRNSK